MTTVDQRPATDAGTLVGPPASAESAPPASPLVQLPTGKRDTRRSRRFSGLERFLGVVLFFALWELAVRVGWISPKACGSWTGKGTRKLICGRAKL